MYKKHTLIIFTLCAAFIFTGCTRWNTRDWKQLKDRKFYFTKFIYVHRNAGVKKAFAFMKDFPVRQTLDMLGEKHGIEIDSALYEAFLDKGDPDTIEETGFFQGNTYTWKDRDKHDNSVALSYSFDFDDYDAGRDIHEYRIKILVKTGWRTRAVYTVLCRSRDEALTELKKQIGQK